MFDALTENVRAVFRSGRQAADRGHHGHIDHEHILLGLLHLESGLAIEVLRGLGADVQALRRDVERGLVPGTEESPRPMPFTVRARRIVEGSRDAARCFGHDHIGSGHLLLALLQESDGATVRVLGKQGVGVDALEAALDERLATLPGPPVRPAVPDPQRLTGRSMAAWRYALEMSPGMLEVAFGVPDTLRFALKSQYRAALATMRQAIELCPDGLWNREQDRNRTWQLAYHGLFFAHFYMGTDQDAFEPWAGHQGQVQHPDGIAGRTDPDSPLPLLPEPYTKAQVLAYADHIDGLVEDAVEDIDFAREECGFPWYAMGKLEHALVNIRHIQHHAANIAERLRSAADVGVKWVGRCHPGT